MMATPTNKSASSGPPLAARNDQKSPAAAKLLVKEVVSTRALRGVLDIGCGERALMHQAALQRATAIVGVDISEDFLKYARQQPESKADIQVADIQEGLPFDGGFETVFFCDAIKHRPRSVEALGESPASPPSAVWLS